MDLPPIWDHMTLIWRHCNGIDNDGLPPLKRCNFTIQIYESSIYIHFKSIPSIRDENFITMASVSQHLMVLGRQQGMK